ncbi:MAG: hypothetical protein HFI08_02645 [Bacilli bacterium]|mgnify:CR=1 FL=1|jgi:hypothetical protein|nr:hypothetical protein [Bacilli bacterium]
MAKNKKEEISSKWSEDWIPIKQIMNGMIQLDSGEYVTGIKIQPKNIFILDQGSRENVLYNLRNFYNAIDYEFWLVVADRPVDINVYLSQLQILFNKAQTNISRKLIQEDINKANSFMSAQYNVVDTEYYILFKEKRMELVQKRIHSLISNLANCGLNSSQTSNNDLRVIIDNFFNGGFGTTFSGMVSPE